MTLVWCTVKVEKKFSRLMRVLEKITIDVSKEMPKVEYDLSYGLKTYELHVHNVAILERSVESLSDMSGTL